MKVKNFLTTIVLKEALMQRDYTMHFVRANLINCCTFEKASNRGMTFKDTQGYWNCCC